jgi:hypothetical protein
MLIAISNQEDQGSDQPGKNPRKHRGVSRRCGKKIAGQRNQSQGKQNGTPVAKARGSRSRGCASGSLRR